jgi:hypothetical protein
MKFNKQIEYAVSFAKFCLRQEIAPVDLAELIYLAHRAHEAGVSFANARIGSNRKDAALRRFEAKAMSLGFHTSWSGFNPTITEPGGTEVYLPT